MRIKAVATIAIVAILIAGVLLSLTCVLNFQPSVEITSFTSTGTSSGSSDGTVRLSFILNLTNTGTIDIENLIVTFSANTTSESQIQLIYANSTSPYDRIAGFSLGDPCGLGALKAKETRDFLFYYEVGFGFDAPALTVTLESNEVTLDQATATTPPIPNVKITDFTCLDIHHGTKLGLILDLFSLNYTNYGPTDGENLTLTLHTSKTNGGDPQQPTSSPRYNTYRFLDEYINGDIYHLESIKVNETKNFEKGYRISLYNLEVEPFVLTVVLKCNDTIVDQATINIPISVYYR